MHAQEYNKFIPICHFCGVKGRTRPNCFKLYGYPILESRPHHVNNYGGRTQTPRCRITPHKNNMNGNPKCVPNIVGNVEKVKTRPIWMRISDLRPFVDLPIKPLDDTVLSGGIDLTF